jgi:hypothetical protein
MLQPHPNGPLHGIADHGSFLTASEFTSDKANKLRLWQALAIEVSKP